MKYVLGIDQGGTKTHAMVADENGRILGMAKAGGACHSAHGMQFAMDKVDEAAEKALVQSKISIEQIAVVAAGMTGLDWEEEEELLTEALQKLFPKQQIHVVNDCIIAMRAGTDKEQCCVLCAGTGLNCAVRKDADNEFIYGYYVADEYQGGQALGQKAIQAVFNAETGLQPPTALTALLLEFFNVPNTDELLKRAVTGGINDRKKSEIPLLIEKAAMENDWVSLQILENYGRYIAQYVVAGLKRFEMLSDEVDVILSGSIFKSKVPVLLEALSAEIHRFSVNAKIISCRYEPIVGAVLMALEQLSKPLSPGVYENIEKAANHFNIER
jgi:Predicted N-acetylglucosamine kinase